MSLRPAALVAVLALALSMAAPVRADITTGLDWLEANQHAEGFWHRTPDPDSVKGDVASTAQALMALAEGGETSPDITRGKVWLGHRHAWATGDAAQALEALAVAGENTDAVKDILMDLQRADGTWGSWKGWEADVEETALATRALGQISAPSTSDVQNAIAFLISQQHDGAWGIDHDDDGSAPVSAHDTALVLWGLLPWDGQDAELPGISDAITAAVIWLAANQNADEGWGDDPVVLTEASNVSDTALVTIVLCRSGRDEGRDAAAQGVTWLSGAQGSGSWNDDVLDTAMALRAMLCGMPNVACNGALEFETLPLAANDTVTITMPLKNKGLQSTGAAFVVQFYLGDPDVGVPQPIGTPQPSGPLDPGETDDASIDWDCGPEGVKLICARLDDLDGIDEGSEQDNKCCKALIVGDTPDVAIHFVTPWTSPSIPQPWNTTTPVPFVATAENLGFIQLTGVNIELWKGVPDDAEPWRMFATVGGGVIDAPAPGPELWEPGPAPPITLVAGPQTICARARVDGLDPADEADALNNIECHVFDILGQPNLAVYREDITFNPLATIPPVDLNVSFFVRNTSGVDIDDVHAELYEGTCTGTPMLAPATFPLDAHESSPTFTVTRNYATEGCRDFCVKVYTTDSAIVEADLSDNQATRRKCMRATNAPPVADAGPDQTVDEGELVTLDGNATDPDDNLDLLEWDLDDDGEFDDLDGEFGTVTFAGPGFGLPPGPPPPGVYTVRFRATDDWGEWDVDSATITVNNVAPTVVSAGPVTGFETQEACTNGVAVTQAGLLNSTRHLTMNWPGQSATNLRFGLMGLWRLDGDEVELTGQQGTNAIVGTPTWVDGVHEQALELSGDDTVWASWVDDVSPKALSYSLWIRPTATSGNRVIAVYTQDASTQLRLTWLGATDSVLLTAPGAPSIASVPLSLDAWHHLVVTWSDLERRVRLYVDGSTTPLRQATTGVASFPAPAFGIGWDVSNPSDLQYVGDIDEVRLYGRELTSGEVVALHASPAMIVLPEGPLPVAPLPQQCRAFGDDVNDVLPICLVDDGCADVPLVIENLPPAIEGGDIDASSWVGGTYRGTPTQPGIWTVTAAGDDARQWTNDGQTFFHGDTQVMNTRIEGWISVDYPLLGYWDDDFFGLVLSYRDSDVDVNEIVIDWKQRYQLELGLGPSLPGLAASHVFGPNPRLWDRAGDCVEIARGFTRGSAAWNFLTEYHWVVELTPTRLRVWIDDTLEFDIAGCFQDGALAFYTDSQEGVHFRDFRVRRLGGLEGGEVVLSSLFTDPSLVDTHVASVTWGDGSLPIPATVRQGAGFGGAEASHVYVQDGTYFAQVCVEDDDGGTDCSIVSVLISDVPAVVDAGPDACAATNADACIDLSETFELPPATFTDVGVLDLHDATIDWGDGSPLEPGVVTEANGEGTIEGSHQYGANGLYEVLVCVEDENQGPCLLDESQVNGDAGGVGDDMEVVYENDFTAIPGTEWSHQAHMTTSSNRWFLSSTPTAAFANEMATLTLDLPPHDRVEIEFTWFALNSWDGHPNCPSPDIFRCGIQGGTEFLHATFANNGCFTQSYPDDYTSPSSPTHPRYTGSVEQYTLDPYNYLGSSVYQFVFEADHVDQQLVLYFEALGLEGWTNEGWGIDHIVVRTPRAGCNVELTDAADQASSIFHPQRIPIADDASFSTFFEFQIANAGGPGPEVGGDGMAFVIHADPDGANALGAGLGLEGIAPSVAIEFDTLQDGTDPSGNHVGIDIDGDLDSDFSFPVPGDFTDGASRFAWIEYDGGSHTLELRLSTTDTRPSAALLSETIDLETALGAPMAYLGFTASTSDEFASHRILDWRVQPDGAPFAGCEGGPGGRSCDSIWVLVSDNEPPTCDAGDDATVSCRTARLLGASVSDPDSDPLTWTWSSGNSDVTVSPSTGTWPTDNPADSIATLSSSVSACEPVSALLTLTVSDGQASPAPCTTTVTFHDTVAPEISCPADRIAACGDTEPNAADVVTATDNCGTPTVEHDDSACLIVPQGLVSWWTGDDTAEDRQDGNDGTLENGATYADAHVGRGFTFDGSDDRVRIPHASNLEVNEWSVDAWVIVDSAPATDRALLFGQPGGRCRLMLRPDLKLELEFSAEDGSFPSVLGTTNLTLGTAVLVAGTFDGSDLTLYVNGVEDATASTGGATPIAATCAWFIGGVDSSVAPECELAASSVDGIVDEVEFFDRSIDATVIADLYGAGSLGKCKVDCPTIQVITRTWTATDACERTASCEQVITVQDVVAPVLSGCPSDVTVECTAIPPPASPTATDDCDPEPTIALVETSTQTADGSCSDHTYTITRTWTATDDCGNSASCTQVITVQDTVAPVLSGCPANTSASCGLVPLSPPPTAVDACDDAPVISFGESTTPGNCDGNTTLTRTWTATDACGNFSSCSQVITVTDTTPPVVTEDLGRKYCLWPPDHQMRCFPKSAFEPLISDACGSTPISWSFTGCTSNQPDDATNLGDGVTTGDCTVTSNEVCVRAERQGADTAGRNYSISITATDECGNTGSPTIIGVIHVPHDHRDKSVHDCISASN